MGTYPPILPIFQPPNPNASGTAGQQPPAKYCSAGITLAWYLPIGAVDGRALKAQIIGSTLFIPPPSAVRRTSAPVFYRCRHLPLPSPVPPFLPLSELSPFDTTPRPPRLVLRRAHWHFIPETASQRLSDSRPPSGARHPRNRAAPPKTCHPRRHAEAGVAKKPRLKGHKIIIPGWAARLLSRTSNHPSFSFARKGVGHDRARRHLVGPPNERPRRARFPQATHAPVSVRSQPRRAADWTKRGDDLVSCLATNSPLQPLAEG